MSEILFSKIVLLSFTANDDEVDPVIFESISEIEDEYCSIKLAL